MDHRRWQGMSLEARYQHLHGRSSQPVAEPVAAISLASMLGDAAFSEEELERHAHDRRTARAMIELDRALAEQQAEEAKQRRALLDGTATGALMR
jgi:hypothetical protein